MCIYVNAELAKRFTTDRLCNLAWDYMEQRGGEIKTISAMCFRSTQGGVYLMHPSLNLTDEGPLMAYLGELKG